MTKSTDRWAALDAAARQAGEIPPEVQANEAIEILIADAIAPGVTEHMYMPAESIFGGIAEKVRSRGWTVIPQEREGKRIPSRVDGESIKWGKFIEAMPTVEETHRWAIQARTANGAVLLGPASGNVWALDIDVLDQELSYSVQELAIAILGDTDFRRQGKAPKMALLYRAESIEDLPAYRTFKFMDEDLLNPSPHGVEILGRGRLMTSYGYHHETSEYFKWMTAQPFSHNTDEVPLATPERLEEFIVAVQDLRPFYRAAGIDRSAWIDGDSNGVIVPKLRMGDVQAQWIENEDGIVVDGRENYLWQIARQAVRMNASLAMTPDGVGKIQALVLERFRAKAALTGRWTITYLKSEIWDKVSRSIAALNSGQMTPHKGRVKQVTIEGVARPVLEEDFKPRIPRKSSILTPAFPWITPRRSAIPVRQTEADVGKALERALRTDRAAVSAESNAKTQAAVDAFLDDVEAGIAKIHSLDGATGIGKTAKTLERIMQREKLMAAGSRVEMRDENGNAIEKGAVIVLVPTYNNVDELRAKSAIAGLDPTLSDEDLIAAAEAQGLVNEAGVKEHVAKLRKSAVGVDVRAMTYMGKLVAGCQMEDKVRLLQDAGLKTSSLCKTERRVRDSDGKPTAETEEVFCKHYSTCPAILQREQMTKSNIIFMVRSFMTLSLPEEAMNPWAVVIDERIWSEFVKTTTFPMKSLSAARREPKLTKREREEKVSPFDLLLGRSKAVDLAIDWLKGGKDLAEQFSGWSEVNSKGKTVTGAELIHDCLRVCGSAMTNQSEIHPGLSLQQIATIAAMPTGVDIAKEYRFWAIIDNGMLEHAKAKFSGRDAPLVDLRIQLLDYDAADPKTAPEIRISWKVEGNWSDVPMLLLDASTDPLLIELSMGGGREIVSHKIDVSMNQLTTVAIDRRLSSRQLYPKKDAAPDDFARAARTLADIRLQIATAAANMAHGRLFISMPKKMRRVVLKGWCRPVNTDFGHIGANAGLDYARHHVGVMSIGRLELPVRVVDGIVAALTHGTKFREMPIDRNGNGKDEDGEDLYPSKTVRRLRHRDGSDITLKVQEYEGRVARAVQNQYREENNLQDIGRGRAVHRETALNVIIVSESIPEKLIIDDVMGFEDLATRSGGRLWDAVRLTGGVINPIALAHYAPHLGDVTFFEGMIREWLTETTEAQYHKIWVIKADGYGHPFLVPSHRLDFLELLKLVLQDMGWKGSIRVEEESRMATFAADPAPIDTIENYLLQADQRAVEVAALNRKSDMAIRNKVWRRVTPAMSKSPVSASAVPNEYAINEGSPIAMRLDVWLMLDQMKDQWALEGVEPAATESVPAITVAGDVA